MPHTACPSASATRLLCFAGVVPETMHEVAISVIVRAARKAAPFLDSPNARRESLSTSRAKAPLVCAPLQGLPGGPTTKLRETSRKRRHSLTRSLTAPSSSSYVSSFFWASFSHIRPSYLFSSLAEYRGIGAEIEATERRKPLSLVWKLATAISFCLGTIDASEEQYAAKEKKTLPSS